MVAQTDDVARLLAAEDPALAAERLEHVAVADVGGDHADAVVRHQPVEAEVRHLRHRDQVDAEVEREDGHDLVAVDRIPVRVDGEHPVAVPVEGDAEVVAPAGDGLAKQREIRRSAAEVDVRPVGVGAHGGDLGAERREGPRR